MRAEGYYWVKVNESRDWEIAFWWNESWCFPGFTSQLKTVFEIDERRIERLPQLVRGPGMTPEEFKEKYGQ